MKTFQDFIDEGVNDPGIFKAFFTAGGQALVNLMLLENLVLVK